MGNRKMIRKLLNKIESNRSSKNIFWKISVNLKDFLWKIYTYLLCPFRPTLEWNKNWNNYKWEKNGDEWNNQAAFCNQPYEKWKNSIIENFIKPNITKESTALEIGPGHGRWTEFMLSSKKLFLVDLNEHCIKYCKKKFSKYKNIIYFINNGKKLSFIESGPIDFIFSYDSFVHMEKGIIDSYFSEFSRILKEGGKAIIHHSGHRNLLFYKINKRMAKGCRANVSKQDIRKLANKNNLIIKYQIDSWGKNKEYNCKANGDFISEMVKK
jgi:ubiquinone/menaquinone biosynthesis C-methylase UbiE